MSKDHLPTNELPLKHVHTCIDSRNQIEHPSHYNMSNIEVWDAIIAWGLDFCDGNVIKYVTRASHHTAKRITNLYKARQYILKAIEVEEAKYEHTETPQSINKMSNR